ncbi:pimeloyl-ACP methyl ester carboxylesterase [Streptomyces aurantiacus]|uniref:alpha/beta hydrolase n=1 Tax=Streptomyces aurantiacus TaxID=47760 RepID=UPI00278E3BBA|nr:alpha/beta hydrolase [Streptomyces aurantiacus]MDQ0773885.1 pimeloyl-ACP methyl ester carboxylesterase [Streptomyces aurantiacus]
MPHHSSSRTTAVLVSLAVLAVATVTACDPGSGTGSGSGSGAPAATPAVPAALSDQKLNWTACPAPSAAQGADQKPENLSDGTTWQCTTMKVPLDYAKPDGKTIGLALIRAKASRESGRERIGSLVFNFGGPGASGVPTLSDYAEDEFIKLHEGYDLVSFDPRGVGNSAGVECLDKKAMDAFMAADTTPDDAAEEKAVVRRTRAFAEACESKSGAVLDHVGTEEAARDLDLMRHVLGDKKLNYFGISYGTQLGGVYAHLFPKNVGRTVFDGVVDPTNGILANGLGQAEGFEGALQSFLKDCSKREDCFFEGDDPAVGEKLITEFMASLDGKPLSTEFDRPLTQNLALNALAGGLYSETDGWMMLRLGLAEVATGNGTSLLVLSDILNGRTDDAHGYSNVNAANTAVTCADYKDRFTADDVRKHLPAYRKASPGFGDWIAWALLQCTGWPVAGQAPTVDVSADGAGPILVVGNVGDPATPYEGAKKMADELGKGVGVRLTVDGEGHGTYGDNDCLTAIVDKYLLDGTVPKNDTTCS